MPFTLEADSLNAAVLGPDARPGTPEFDLFIKEVRKEMTAKCGQKCTAIRRAIVPAELLEDVQIALGKALAQTTVGHPQAEGVRMGALAGRPQAERLREQVRQLARHTPIVYGNLDQRRDCWAKSAALSAAKGAFISPIVLLNSDPFRHLDSHEIEAFGPVVTLMPYHDPAEAVRWPTWAKARWCAPLPPTTPHVAQEFVLGAATHHGRILVLNGRWPRKAPATARRCRSSCTAAPAGPAAGRKWAASGAWSTFMQRVALQGSPSMITAITQVYQTGAKRVEYDKHPFQRYFEELEIGETYTTHHHTVTEADISLRPGVGR